MFILNFLLWTLFVLVIFFCVHFISFFFVRKIKKNPYDEYRKEIFRHNDFFIEGVLYGTPDIMVTIRKSGFKHSKIWIIYGGFSIEFNYKTDDVSGRTKIKHYGLYSVDGELFWEEFWWGEEIYMNPFRLNTKLYDMVIDIKNRKKYETKYIVPYESPYVWKLQDTVYINKNGEHQPVHEITFWVEETMWVVPFLHFLHLDKLYNWRRVAIWFDTNEGLGTDRDTWDGGVCGAMIDINDEKSFVKAYDKYMSGQMTRSQFRQILNGHVHHFMKEERKF